MADQETAKPSVREIGFGDIAGHRRLWHTCRALDIPYVVLSKDQKYARVKYDMWVTERDLSSEAVEKIKEIFAGFFRANKGIFRCKVLYWVVGPTNGYFPDMEISKARELAGEIARVVRDRKNHIPLRKGLP